MKGATSAVKAAALCKTCERQAEVLKAELAAIEAELSREGTALHAVASALSR